QSGERSAQVIRLRHGAPRRLFPATMMPCPRRSPHSISGAPAFALGHAHMFRLVPVFSQARAPLRPLAGGEGGARRGCAGRVRWVARLFGRAASPHLTLTLSAPNGGEGIFRPPVWL